MTPNPYVSNRALLALLKTMSAEGHDLAPVFVGLPFARASLDTWSGRVHWNDYIEFFERIEARLGADTFLRLAYGYSTAFPEFRANVPLWVPRLRPWRPLSAPAPRTSSPSPPAP